jgi:hypothetical protein
MKKYKATKIYVNGELIAGLLSNKFEHIVDWLMLNEGPIDTDNVIDTHDGEVYQVPGYTYLFAPCTRTEMEWLLATTLKGSPW